MVMVKLVAAVLALTFMSPAAVAVLQVTPSLVPKESSRVKRIWLFAVTAVVLTTTVLDPAATTTEPAAADEHAAGEADDEQLAAVA